jgi:predicted nucleotidyltransferase
MLKLFNDLKPFFENNYKRIHIREYAKLMNISPPTASKQLEGFVAENLLKKEIDKQYFYYYAKKESELFKALQQLYWKQKLEELIEFIEKNTINPIIILFGSTAKAEIKENSDIDIAIFTISKKEIDIKTFEKKLKKNIQLFKFKKLEETPKNLQKNILNGYKLAGQW